MSRILWLALAGVCLAFGAAPARAQQVNPVVGPDGKIRAEADGNTINLWDLATGRLLAKIRTGGGITSLSYSPDGKTLTSREADNSKKVFDAATGKRLE